MLRSSVQMVMLTAPDVKATADFYVEHLAFRIAEISDEEAIVEGYGMQIVLSPGPGATHAQTPSHERASVEIPSTMARIEALWERDRARDPNVLGPMLDASGAFVYVTLDPARNALALLSPLPSERDELRQERVTQKLKRPDFG